MKRPVFCALFILLAAVICAEKVTTGGATAMQYINSQKRMIDKRVIVQYDAKEKLAYVYFEDVMGNYAVVLNEKKKAEFMGIISAYLKMETEISGKGIKAQKRLGNIITSLYFRYGDKWYMSRPDVPVFVRFLSQSESVHQMVFMYGAAIAAKDQSITLSPSDRYFSKEQAQLLYAALEKRSAGVKKGKSAKPGR
jgi:hypothetical protein